jgi:signal transduction histidine kinase
MLPFKQSSREAILRAARQLLPNYRQIGQNWRRMMAEEFAFDEATLAVLQHLNPPDCSRFFEAGDFDGLFEQINYFGTRLAKLQVDTRAVARSLELSQAASEPYFAELGAEERAEHRAALEMLSSAIFVTVSGAYFDTQRKESNALLSVLDAELSATNLTALQERVLEIMVSTFSASVGLLLMRDFDADVFRPKAWVGLEQGLGDDVCIVPGQGFSGTIALRAEPAVLPDLTKSHGVLNPLLVERARTLWGMPLKAGDQVIGVLLIGFSKRYDWLPTERELMRAIADRSALAIERARITEALREREMRIAELSGHLLQAQEEERKRISRELHDETGQALMVIRLYLGMLETNLYGRAAKAKVRETLGVVDRTIEGIRRIIARLSPLVLKELGLIAAVRKEAKDLTKGHGIKARVAINESVGRMAPEIETALYRVVQEALHNVARHSQAKSVNIQMDRNQGRVTLVIEDDGVGINKNAATNKERPSFGLAGIRERIGVLGGQVKITSVKSKGTRLEIGVPAELPVEHRAAESRAERRVPDDEVAPAHAEVAEAEPVARAAAVAPGGRSATVKNGRGATSRAKARQRAS